MHKIDHGTKIGQTHLKFGYEGVFKITRSCNHKYVLGLQSTRHILFFNKKPAFAEMNTQDRLQKCLSSSEGCFYATGKCFCLNYQ